ncbi:MAG: VWA domain-containing protein [Betaproteobacteria bacterium]|nr:VWA domain-containing protein [Betaproteobacteria bacterium]
MGDEIAAPPSQPSSEVLKELDVPAKDNSLAKSKAEPQRHMREEKLFLGESAVAKRGIYPAVPSPALQSGEFSRYAPLPENTEKYQHIAQHSVQLVFEHPVSTFSIDVDTGSYANVRRFLNDGQLPPADAVRVEEMINYFPYAYASPSNHDPFAAHTEIAATPWNRDTHLLRIAIKGKDLAKASLPPANLVFLIDVSGSMDEPNKLPLLKSAFTLFTKELRAQDKVGIVVYAGASGVVLEPTSGAHQGKILAALDRLSAGGSTHGAAGIELAYRVARQAFIPDGINRVLLATDGDFNVGVTNFEALKNLIEQYRKTGISLSTLGFGTGNYNDQLMEQLAGAGNGHYSYIDTLNEARKALVDEFTSTLATIAKDVKIQVEFNPATVAEYRLIGYENRALNREDFNNDKVDAGDIGAGHTVTALYEIRLRGHGKSLTDPLRYQQSPQHASRTDEVALLRLRHKDPNGSDSKLMETAIRLQDERKNMEAASPEFRFAVAVAAFGQELKGGKYLGNYGYEDIHRLAQSAASEDKFGYRREFLELVKIARNLATNTESRLDIAQ